MLGRLPVDSAIFRFITLVVACIITANGYADDDQPWAFRAPRRSALPEVDDIQWSRTPLDRFVLEGLAAESLHPAPAADRRTLARRLYFDLLGLPPTPEQMASFLDDPAPDAYERLVDELLASPHYGERWAQHWLDVVRYADSDGFEYDDPRPHAWRYRDWVIRSLNGGKPFDRFVREQLAADELGAGDSLAALGLHRLGPLRLNAGMQDEAKNRQEVLTEMVDAVGAALLGMTLGCARCHDHMFDPISQAEYYQLQAFFAGTWAEDIAVLNGPEQTRRQQQMKKWQQRVKQVRDEIAAVLARGRRRVEERRSATGRDSDADREVTDEEARAALETADVKLLAKVEDQLEQLTKSRPPEPPSIMAVRERVGPTPATFVLNRGDPHQRQAEVKPRFPAFLVANPAGDAERPGRGKPAQNKNAAPTAGRRAALANWLTQPRHPLTARVFVNRVWQHHFGRGIVATPNDFGAMGSEPTHPELLDWLTVDFIEHDWSIKRLHRRILLSATYRQRSDVRPVAAIDRDPDNRLLWRGPRRRLEAESLRDSLLAVSGELNRQAGGPGVRLPLPPEVARLQYKGTWQPDPDPSAHRRRSVFVFVKRNNRPPLLELFDTPNTLVPAGRRTQSIHAGQALTLLNGVDADKLSHRFAARVIRDCGSQATPDDLVRRAYAIALGRPPRPAELRRASAFLQSARVKAAPLIDPAKERPHDLAAAGDRLADLCLVLFNLDEFLFID